MNIRHESMFSFETLLKYEPQNRLAVIFDTLDLQQTRLQIAQPSNRGSVGYSKNSLLLALLSKHVYGIPNTAKLLERLSSDIGLRYDCGLPLYGGILSVSNFCRFIQSLADTPVLQNLFDCIVQKALATGIMKGTSIAIDH